MIHDRVAYCAPRGIPYTRFVGGPDVWDRLSRVLAVAWDRHERQRCPGCGTHPDDWDESRGGDRNAFYADDYKCLGDEYLTLKRQEIKDKGPGWRVGLVRRPLVTTEGGGE